MTASKEKHELIEQKERAEQFVRIVEDLPGSVLQNTRMSSVNLDLRIINLWPHHADTDGRRLAGTLMKLPDAKMEVVKPYDGATHLHAEFSIGGWTYCVVEYRPATCKIVEREVELPAEPAKPARTEIRRELVCEGGKL